MFEKELIIMQTTRKKIKITVEKTDTGFTASCFTGINICSGNLYDCLADFRSRKTIK